MNQKRKNLITCYEHDTLKVSGDSKNPFGDDHLELLQRYYGNQKTDAFSLIHKGVKFNQFVGVLQVRDLTIEVLPKIDRQPSETAEQTATYRKVLLQMLKESGLLNVRVSDYAHLRLYQHNLLEHYLAMFVKECETIVRNGLLKQYRKRSGNLPVLKGALQFNKHIRDNLIHQERFHTRHTIYDPVNYWNQTLYKTLLVLSRMTISPGLQNRVSNLLLQFPEMPGINVNDTYFKRLPYHRKTERYRPAMELARLILLNYHPDVMGGDNRVFALMFDMNRLWESWVLYKLKKSLEPQGYKVKGQRSKLFWQSPDVSNKKLQPDIVMDAPQNQRIIIDTKWKTPDGPPGDDDLRQLYAYLQYFDGAEGILLYPGNRNETTKGHFVNTELNGKEVFLNIINAEGKAELKGADLLNAIP